MKNAKKTMATLWPAAMALCLTAMMNSCAIAPVNSHYESARSLKKNNIEAMGSFTYYSETDLDNSNNNLGLRLGYGITDNIDVKFTYERFFPAWEEDKDLSVNYFSFSPKASFLRNTLALKLPFNMYTYSYPGEESESIFMLNPTLLGTLPISNQFEVGLACSYQFNVSDRAEDELGPVDFIGLSLGFGLSSDLDRWAIRPEFGYLFAWDSADDGIFNFGIGLTYNFDLNK